MKKTYEEICLILEEKMKVIDNENTPLFELVDAYKDGIKLINEARGMLELANKEIELIYQNKELDSNIQVAKTSEEEEIPF